MGVRIEIYSEHWFIIPLLSLIPQPFPFLNSPTCNNSIRKANLLLRRVTRYRAWSSVAFSVPSSLT